MENWISFFYEYGGIVFAALGVATATICGGIGSTIGVGMTSESAAGLIAEQPEKFGQALILELLKYPRIVWIRYFVYDLRTNQRKYLTGPWIVSIYRFFTDCFDSDRCRKVARACGECSDADLG